MKAVHRENCQCVVCTRKGTVKHVKVCISIPADVWQEFGEACQARGMAKSATMTRLMRLFLSRTRKG